MICKYFLRGLPGVFLTKSHWGQTYLFGANPKNLHLKSTSHLVALVVLHRQAFKDNFTDINIKA